MLVRLVALFLTLLAAVFDHRLEVNVVHEKREHGRKLACKWVNWKHEMKCDEAPVPASKNIPKPVTKAPKNKHTPKKREKVSKTCSDELVDLFGDTVVDDTLGKPPNGSKFVLAYWGEPFRAVGGHQASRKVSSDAWETSVVMSSHVVHIIQEWERSGLSLSRVVSSTYSTHLDKELLHLLKATFKVPVELVFTKNTGDKSGPIRHTLETLIRPGENALLMRFDLMFFRPLPPPRLDLIMFPHCMALTELPQWVAESFVWVPSSKLSVFRNVLKKNRYDHKLSQFVKPFSLFYKLHMCVDPERTNFRDGVNEGVWVTGAARPYDVAGRTPRSTIKEPNGWNIWTNTQGGASQEDLSDWGLQGGDEEAKGGNTTAGAEEEFLPHFTEAINATIEEFFNQSKPHSSSQLTQAQSENEAGVVHATRTEGVVDATSAKTQPRAGRHQ